jgi:hypothetical protein
LLSVNVTLCLGISYSPNVTGAILHQSHLIFND